MSDVVTCVVRQACLKVNPDAVVYPNLISLEVSEADVLSRAADEQASRLRPSDAAAAADKLKPEVMLFCSVASYCLLYHIDKILFNTVSHIFFT